MNAALILLLAALGAPVEVPSQPGLYIPVRFHGKVEPEISCKET